MSTQTIVYGYVEGMTDQNDFNRARLAEFEYDETYPFRNVFSSPREAYRTSILSFADSIKATHQDWCEWVHRFEELIVFLDAISAEVRFSNDASSESLCLSYLYVDGAWKRWRVISVEREQDESSVTR